MKNINPSEISSILRKKLENFNLEENTKEILNIGNVIEVRDGIVRVYGLNDVFYGEILQFNNNIYGIVLNIEEDSIISALFENINNVKEGDKVKKTNKFLTINVGKSMLGRIVNTLGKPIDGKGKLEGDLFEIPLEREAPGVIYRQPVYEPFYTGIKFIDSMIPIGKGQRELIIGDRQTGKTTIAIDTIINQKQFYNTNNPVYCIYVSIGQKNSSLANVIKILEENDALKYTIIVSSNSSETPLMQVFAPFTGTSIGEYFRDIGKHVLIIYDDLSKHAVSYREISLLLKRPPGREAYPGDVFFLHSRLLERSAKIIENDNIFSKMNGFPKSIKKYIKSGGSLTALPIIETKEGDISSYIPTNVISITDGQIFLEKDLFNSGVRPAINDSISVSRVGGAAQIYSMKKVSGTLKLNQAQYKELEAFSSFGSDLDEKTEKMIKKGKLNVELLKQDANNPYKISYQIAVIYLCSQDIIIPLNKIKKFEKEYLKFLKKEKNELLKKIDNGFWNEEIINDLNKVIKKVLKSV